jgi:hypothetical protein
MSNLRVVPTANRPDTKEDELFMISALSDEHAISKKTFSSCYFSTQEDRAMNIHQPNAWRAAIAAKEKQRAECVVCGRHRLYRKRLEVESKWRSL